jgi:hypothetical protein
MSEYQYFEFRAIDRPLDDRQMRELRAVSSRAVITPTSFTNEYQWFSNAPWCAPRKARKQTEPAPENENGGVVDSRFCWALR